MGALLPALLCGFGFLLTIIAHFAVYEADRRARERYEAIMGDLEPQVNKADDLWQGLRHYAGWWGCLKIVFQVVRGLGALLMAASLAYLALA